MRKAPVLMNQNFQQGSQQKLLHVNLMLDHKELTGEDLLHQEYEVVLEMAQEMWDPEILVFLVLASHRLLQSELQVLGEFRIILLQVHQGHRPNPVLHQDPLLGSVPSNWVAPDPPG